MLSSESFKGISIVGPPPLGHLYLRLEPGLTALYGQNGAGKTLTLMALTKALRDLEQVQQSDFSSRELLERAGKNNFFLRSAIDIVYSTSCLHFHLPITKQFWDSGDVPDQLKKALVLQYGTMSDKAFHGNDSADWDDIVLGVLSALPNEATVEIAESYLREGRWLVASGNGNLYLCDRDPLQGPLASLWAQCWLEFEKEAQSRVDNAEQEKLWREEEYGEEYTSGEAYTSKESALFSYFDRAEYGAEGGFWELKEPRLPALLPPPPWLLGLPSFPDWMSFPVAAIGKTSQWRFDSISEDDAPISNSQTASKIAASTLEESQAKLDSLVVQVNSLFAQLFEHPPLLRATISTNFSIFHGQDPVSWSASTDDAGTFFPVQSLGRAHQRYLNFALECVLEDRRESKFKMISGKIEKVKSQPTFALIDEPELALHPAAQRYLAESIRFLAEYVVTSTHSSEFIDAAQNTTLVSQSEGKIELKPFLVDFDPEKRIFEARRLGTTPGQLALLTRAVVFVEGPHDAAIIGAFLKEELQQHRVLIVPLMGTKDVAELVNTEFLVGATNCPIFLCLDNIDLDFVLGLSSKLKKAVSQEQQRLLLAEANNSVVAQRHPEIRQMIRTLSAIATNGMLQRFTPFGFKQHDIVQMLPVELIKPGATTWEELEKNFLVESGQKSFKAGDGAAFKRFVGPGYTLNGIREALDILRLTYEERGGTLESNRPPELDRLASQISRIVSNVRK
jgi:energy-coupling factor transporter ATP-binding protein EcfA2